ncbi:diguanylate cyclase [Fuscovulum blasticum]|uniref:diguanylate cyclase n=1 Tax=Fuscovulum blasticum TaxID=1075 RepID=UPI000D3E9FA4|nr:diguanylate cyclase [Fuscovulum blasticum]AWD22839.1 diguanylate cyclase response regulator [Fuscovulum blasticum]
MHGRILIVDDTATNRIVYKVKLSDAFYEPLLAADGATGLRLAQDAAPDLVLLDLSLRDLPGPEVLRRLKANPLTRAIPVIALSASPGAADRGLALAAGADDVMSRPLNDAALLARMRNLLRLREEARFVTRAWGHEAPSILGMAEGAAPFDPAPFTPAGTVALVTSRVELALAWKHQLRRQMRDGLVVMSREQALALPPARDSTTPDVFVVEADLDAPGGGLRLMSELGSHAGTRHSATCIITPGEDDETTVMAFDMGADDVLSARLCDHELAPRLRTLIARKRQADRIRATVEDGLRLSIIDPLTGIYNRRYALPRLAGIAAQAASEGSDFAVMVVDLDRFKSVNDRFGHAAGDAVLVEVARRLSENLRLTDMLARIGGEEFLVALPQTTLPEAERVAERLRQMVCEAPVTLPSGDGLHVTVSIGVALGARRSEQTEDVSTLVDRADQALLSSKSAGRNVVTFSRNAA